MRKITDERLMEEVKLILDLGNPEIEQIIEKFEEKIKEFELFLEPFEIWTSGWFMSKDIPSPSERYSSKHWEFTRLIGLNSENDYPKSKGKEDIDFFINSPEFECLRLSVNVGIPNFKGSQLDIPEGKRIEFNDLYSGWSIYLIYPPHDKEDEKKSERLKYSLSLRSFENIFKISIRLKAYIRTRFEDFQRFNKNLKAIHTQLRSND
jgi:hypothetical protein